MRYKVYCKCSVQGRQQQFAIERTPATADVHEQATVAGTPATAGLVATEETLATVDIPRTLWTNDSSRDASRKWGVCN
jgi:hypothetical protein